MSLDGGYTTNNAVLNSSAQSNFSGAIQYLEIARSAAYEADRVAAAKTARQLAVSAASSIGTNLTYTIGQGTVMF